ARVFRGSSTAILSRALSNPPDGGDDQGRQIAMRRRNWRIVIVGAALVVIAIGFFLFMLSIASKSNDSPAWMQTVGTVSGVVGGIAIAMIIIGLIGKKV